MPKPATRGPRTSSASFVAIYETRSLTAAAARLYVTQPAVSQALGRLRRDLNDPLFRARRARRWSRRPLAVSLFPGFRDAIAGIDRTIDGVRGLRPGDSRAVAPGSRCRSSARSATSRRSSARCAPAAPHLRIEAVPLDVQALPEWLVAGHDRPRDHLVSGRRRLRARRAQVAGVRGADVARTPLADAADGHHARGLHRRRSGGRRGRLGPAPCSSRRCAAPARRCDPTWC